MKHKETVEEIIERVYSMKKNADTYSAINELLSAIHGFPGNIKIETALASHYIAVREYENAVVYLQPASMKRPRIETISRSLFWCLWKSNRIDDAYQELDRFFQVTGRYSEEYEVYLLSAMNRISEEEWDERMTTAAKRRKEKEGSP